MVPSRARRPTWTAWGALPLACGLLLAAAPARSAGDEATRARMREIFTSMQVLLPLSADGDLAAPDERAQVTRALESLAADAELLARHAAQDDPARGFLGRSLAADARNALERYREGRTESAAFLVQQATENCIACHSKLRSPGDSPVAAHFVDATALARLRPEERARLQIATRQFDDALTTLEGLFADASVHPSTMLGPLTDYLIVSVRVKGDYDRPVPVLERFAKRPDLWQQLRADVEQWVRDLRALRPLRDQPPSLETARKLVQEARSVQPLAPDERSLVRYVVASGILHRWLEGGAREPAERSEAWSLLGLCELQTGDTFWLSQAEFYLETAIRSAPGSEPAKRAYELLEAETIESYTGAAGMDLPPSVAARLAELHALAEGRAPR
jgi:hypothetical protein